MPIIPVRVSDEEVEILKALAKYENVYVSALMRNTTFEKFEDQYDIKIAEQALKEHQKDPIPTSLKDAMKQYGL